MTRTASHHAVVLVSQDVAMEHVFAQEGRHPELDHHVAAGGDIDRVPERCVLIGLRAVRHGLGAHGLAVDRDDGEIRLVDVEGMIDVRRVDQRPLFDLTDLERDDRAVGERQAVDQYCVATGPDMSTSKLNVRFWSGMAV